jgi:hypothetical protein
MVLVVNKKPLTIAKVTASIAWGGFFNTNSYKMILPERYRTAFKPL